ncbi:MAG: NAD-specific glutamate dehydrogenase [Gammaproteobacteria bacterium]|jgi:glutamate dehydrogenase|nr:NAD-specific glutamate dehydrogenase [Gammaproteobacteria bacterium]
MSPVWIEQLQVGLIKHFGDKKGKLLYTQYKTAFSASYQDDCSIVIALADIAQIEQLSQKKLFQIDFYQLPEKAENLFHLRLFQYKKAIPLSDILPILENMGLRTFDERPYKIELEKTAIYISDFSVAWEKKDIVNINKIKPIFQEAFTHICFGLCENDGLNKLVLAANLSWREISVLRAYTKYLHQVGFRFSQAYIEKTLVEYVEVTKDLISLFKLRNDPKRPSQAKNAIADLEKIILRALDVITSLDDDRIMRRFLQLIQATLRTNYFQKKDGRQKEYLSFKLKSSGIPELPLPIPLYEIFVYSPRFEGIHLRSAKVARGGIRWSDRPEDFRTEILGLMKAQKVKNAVIVPSGAKGGFVLKALSSQADRTAVQSEVVHCYKAFIRALLDITDNFKNNKIIRPQDVYCYDDEDPYLVVAADKGTATFSDIANSLSKEYHFWLGDAFASGGSIGYDHKKIGITARGAWESVRRHFRELNIDLDQPGAHINVIGIGDMSGDVFGNGMIYSSRIKLVGAFDHRHIFIDPNPDSEKSYKERLRLFNLPLSSWEDYNPKIISTGGGVFKRTSKSIPLSGEMKKLLDIQDNSLSPNELIRALLKAPVDLLFNGGIGTYVKSSKESQADVGDKANEFCRINGSELRCRVVGEGGNLGFTQLGRVEYALHGGLINTDFIDNSAGVDCSDNEVNIKILLNAAIVAGHLTEKKRNSLLSSMTHDVAALVLKDNYNQALTMSFSALSAVRYSGLYQNYLKELEMTGLVDREVEFLPDDKTILDRKAAGKGLTRPELAVLLAYSKIHIKNEILKSDLPEDPYYIQMLESAFPKILGKSFHAYMKKHSLRREIIATQLSNRIVNEMGITFFYRVQTESGATIAEIIRAHTISSEIFGSAALGKLIDSLGTKIEVSLQYELLHYVRNLLNLSSRWFLRSHYLHNNIKSTIEHFSLRIKKLEGLIPDLMSGETKKYLSSLIEQFIHHGVEEEVANRIAIYRVLYTTLNIIEIATRHKFDLIKTAKVYFHVGAQFNLVWFRDQIAADSREGHWNTLARLALRDELDVLQKMLTVGVMHSNQKEANVNKLIEHWMQNHKRPIERWEQILQLLHGSTSTDYTMFFVALRELSGWVQIREAC